MSINAGGFPAFSYLHGVDNRPNQQPIQEGSDNGSVFAEADEGQVIELARHLSRTATNYTDAHPESVVDEFKCEKDSELDPFSVNFNTKAWTRRMVGMARNDPNSKMRTAGVSFKSLSVNGIESSSSYQSTVGNVPLMAFEMIASFLGGRKKKDVHILKDFNGYLEAGEMLVVLGPPGSGCSTFLKTLSGEVSGLTVNHAAEINYQGISNKEMHKNFRGEVIYTAEQDIHFPNITVGDTLAFAAHVRSYKTPPPGFTHKEFTTYIRDVVMAVLGISHTVNTRVGNEIIRGVSGGERKRVSIAEAMLAGAPLQCWDNSTRGLDAANAVEFCRTLKTMATYMRTTTAVAIYQSPQAAYDCFDKVTVLYEGYQIYFGKIGDAKKFFTDMGFHCPEQQATPDFLTSLTSPNERIARKGMEHRVPRTAQEFAQRWKESDEHRQLMEEIAGFNKRYPYHGEQLDLFLASRRSQQSKRTSARSPYTLSYGQEVMACLNRGFIRLKADPSLLITQLFGNFVMSLIVASAFYNLPQTSSSFFNRGGLLYFAALINAFGSALEILTLYAQRPIVEKHHRYAFYHPSAEALASMLCDMPYKVTNVFTANIALYFMTNLRREPGAFFFFILNSFLSVLAMSSFFRTIASVSRSLVQALTPAAGLIIGMVLYSGFALPIPSMLGWISWFRWLNPIFYSFESFMINEFAGREYTCDGLVPQGPGYAGIAPENQVCSAVGSEPGRPTVSGTRFITLSYQYFPSHKWRNIGILCVFIAGLTTVYLAATELIQAQSSKGEVAVYPRGKQPVSKREKNQSDIESVNGSITNVPSQEREVEVKGRQGNIQGATATFSWMDLCYDVQIKKETRRILNNVDGWVKPGTLTALMGVSGAGKTTLLDVLASRVTMGVVTGDMLIDGRPRDSSFQRKTGYCQQQDLHLATATVRESLEFSALLRQPERYSKEERLEYVNEVLRLLEMESYQHAVVGNLGEGLNVEQRKRLTIGVELVARPELLFFVDEPTSGLDSQTSWSILSLLEKLSHSGQAILCTIHQPSAMLFSRFDRLLFLAKGGRTVYFEEIGKNSEKLIAYFEKNGGPKYTAGSNPAEWMLEVIGAAPGSHTNIDWPKTWLESPERASVRAELEKLRANGYSTPAPINDDPSAYNEFGTHLGTQFVKVFQRTMQQLWRNPSYIYSKISLVAIVGLFIGFSLFRANNSQQGLQNQLMSIFLIFSVFGQLLQQILPEFVTQRELYEVRERPSKTYSWKIFMLANILAELPWNSLAALVLYLTWYYPIGLYRNAEPTDAVHERGAVTFLLMWTFMMFTSTFGHFVVAALPSAEVAGNIANLISVLWLIFCGVIVPKTQLGWWIWVYWMSPFHYLAEGLLTAAVANTRVVCAAREYLQFAPPAGQTCGTYMQTYISTFSGYLLDPSSTTQCQFCAIADTNVFLGSFNMKYDHAWRNFGLMMIFIVFNACGALCLYYWARVPKSGMAESKTQMKKETLSEKS